MAKARIVEIEICGPKAEKYFFRPLGRALRGRIRFDDVLNSDTADWVKAGWRDPIPGQVLGVNTETGTKWVREPLCESDHQHLRDRIKEQGCTLPVDRELVEANTISDWLFWMIRAVEDGYATVVKLTAQHGDLPPVDSLPEKPRKGFIIRTEMDPTESAFDRLATVVEGNTKAIKSLLASTQKLP